MSRLNKHSDVISHRTWVYDNVVTSLFVFCLGYDDVKVHRLKLMSELMEVNNEEIVKQLSEQLSSHKFRFTIVPRTTYEREAFFNFLRHFVTEAEYLRIWLKDWSENELKKLFDAIKSSNNKKVCFTFISTYQFKQTCASTWQNDNRTSAKLFFSLVSGVTKEYPQKYKLRLSLFGPERKSI